MTSLRFPVTFREPLPSWVPSTAVSTYSVAPPIDVHAKPATVPGGVESYIRSLVNLAGPTKSTKFSTRTSTESPATTENMFDFGYFIFRIFKNAYRKGGKVKKRIFLIFGKNSSLVSYKRPSLCSLDLNFSHIKNLIILYTEEGPEGQSFRKIVLLYVLWRTKFCYWM